MGNDSNRSGDHSPIRQLEPEQARDREVYRYLLTLTDLGLSPKFKVPNETSIARQWGVEGNRIFVRRVLRSVLYEEYYEDKHPQDSPPPVPGLTLSKLVNILSSLQNYRREQQRSLKSDSQPKRAITPPEMLNALNIFGRLSSSERNQLSLKESPGEITFGQILEKAINLTPAYKHTQAFELHNFFLKQIAEQPAMSFAEKLSSRGKTADEYIYQLVSKHTSRYFSGLEPKEKDHLDAAYVGKVKREIDRINLQSGIEQADSSLKLDSDIISTPRLHKYLTAGFVQRLVQSVIDNELVTDEFPIHIKFIEMKRVKPLPLYLRKEDENIFALNPSLLTTENDTEADNIEGLEQQVAYRVRVHFYIKLPPDYKVKFDGLTVVNTIAKQDRLEFFEEVIGIGCPTSHITTAINRVVLWDIYALNAYIPVVNGIHCNDEIMGGTPNSPVWSSCTARVYKRADITKAIESDEHRDDVATTVEIASADFCGFDLIETSAKAALLARLKLVKQILSKQPKISANDYINQLCNRVEEMTALKRAKTCLTLYPFSLRAMEGQLDATIFKDHYRKRKPGFIFKAVGSDSQPEWTTAALEAQMKIAEAYLLEGLSHIAKRYLECIRFYFDGKDQYQVTYALRAKYCICWFRYYYLGDLEHQKDEFPDRYFAVRQADEKLEEAEHHIKERLKRYAKLNELAQVNLSPHFYLLSCIHAHRAKLYIFFPKYMRKLSSAEMLIEPVRLLEKARIYAARDGDPALYAQWSAYQSWCYIMLAYLNRQEDAISDDFSAEKCFIWAEQLTKHADICLSSTGRVCYQQIKDSGGKTTKYYITEDLPNRQAEAHKVRFIDSSLEPTKKTRRYYEMYGSTAVEVVPLIKELFYDQDVTETDKAVEKEAQDYNQASNIVSLDFSLLKKRNNDEESSIYLFGMRSAILLFAKGMLALCKPYESDAELVNAIDHEALRMFNYCCAIASDGTQRNIEAKHQFDKSQNAIVLNRSIPSVNEAQADSDQVISREDTLSRDRLLQSLYPHRLTQFADLGSIFIIACELILWVSSQSFKGFYTSTQKWADIADEYKIREDRINTALKNLIKNDKFPFPIEEACGQKRYNGHLAEHYLQLEKSTQSFMAKLKQRELPDIRSIPIRDQVVTEFFKIIRGETRSL
jgi:hypothetical protein